MLGLWYACVEVALDICLAGFGDFDYLVILVVFYCLTLLLALELIVFCVVLDWYFSALTVSFAVLRVGV